MSDVSVLQTE